MPLGMVQGADVRATSRVPSAERWSSAMRRGPGRDVGSIGWYDVFARWKLGHRPRRQLRRFLKASRRSRCTSSLALRLRRCWPTPVDSPRSSNNQIDSTSFPVARRSPRRVNASGRSSKATRSVTALVNARRGQRRRGVHGWHRGAPASTRRRSPRPSRCWSSPSDPPTRPATSRRRTRRRDAVRRAPTPRRQPTRAARRPGRRSRRHRGRRSASRKAMAMALGSASRAARTTSSAPQRRASADLSSSLTTAVTDAPNALASWMAADPLLPAAPSTTTRSPAASCPGRPGQSTRSDRGSKTGRFVIGLAVGHREHRRGVGQCLVRNVPLPLRKSLTVITRAPIERSTPSPTAVTTPASSWPGVKGSGGVSG